MQRTNKILYCTALVALLGCGNAGFLGRRPRGRIPLGGAAGGGANNR